MRSHVLGGVECEAAGEYGEAPEDCSLVSGEKIVAPVERRAKRLLPWDVPDTGRQYAQLIVEAVDQILERHRAHSCRSGLDREWHPAKSLTGGPHELLVIGRARRARPE